MPASRGIAAQNSQHEPRRVLKDQNFVPSIEDNDRLKGADIVSVDGSDLYQSG